jgi:alpha-1,6-mannosyltransferase
MWVLCVCCQLVCCQFHVPFYCTRLLPNIFAAVVVNVGLAFYARALRQPRSGSDSTSAVAAFALACVVCRCDMVLLALPCVAVLLLTGRLWLRSLVLAGGAASLASIALTVAVDSFFWRRLLWPELAVLVYNNPVEGKYDLWGASPPLWYFISALPRGLMATLLIVPLGCLLTLPTVKRVTTMWKQPMLLLQVDPIAVQLVGCPALGFEWPRVETDGC